MIINPTAAQVEFLGHGGVSSGGGVAKKLLNNGMKVNALRTNATLRDKEWIDIDQAVLQAAQPRLVGVADIKSRGLVYDMGGRGLASTVLEYEDISDMGQADINMDGVTEANSERQEFSLKHLPLPIMHKRFSIGVRTLNASRERGTPLDTTQAQTAARKVAQTQEYCLFNGYNNFTFGGGVLYGYLDTPTRHTVDMAKDWLSCNGEEIVADVLAMVQTAQDNLHYGPFIVYISSNYQEHLGKDYKALSADTILDRIKKVDGVQAVRFVPLMEDNQVLLVEMSIETVRAVTGLPLQTLEWDTEGGMMFHFRVMTIDVIQIRADQYGNSGIVHLRAAPGS